MSAGVHKSGGQIAVATIFCTAVPNTRGSSVWNLLRVTVFAPTILICADSYVEKLLTPCLQVTNFTEI